MSLSLLGRLFFFFSFLFLGVLSTMSEGTEEKKKKKKKNECFLGDFPLYLFIQIVLFGCHHPSSSCFHISI